MLSKKKLILIIILIVYLLFVVWSMGQPFHGDEVIFSESAKGILEKGAPIIDMGVNNQNILALYHVPLYIYIMSGFIFLFGYNPYSFRLVSVIFSLLTIVLVYLIVKEILKDNKNKENWALFASLLYALNPLVIQSSILLDIDGGLLNFAIYLFFYFFIKGKKFYYLIPALVFVLLSKEVGAPLIFITLIVFFVLTFKWKEIPKTVLLFLISFILFLGVWWLFASLLGLDFMMPIEFNYFSGSFPFDLSSLIIAIYEFKNFVYFANPFFILLFAIFTIIFYFKIIKKRDYLKQEDNKKILLFNLFALLIILLYLRFRGSSYGFPKYHIIAMPAICIFVTYIISKSNIMLYFKKILTRKKLLFVLLVIVLIFYFLVIIKDPLIPEFDSAPQNIEIKTASLLTLKTFTLYVIVPFLICFLGFSLARFKGKIYIILIFLTLFLFLYINIVQASASYSTYSKYGDYGIPEVVDYFKNNNIPTREIAAHIHLGSYLGISEYYEIYFSYNNPEQFRKEIVDNEGLEYLVIWERDIARIGENMQYFELEKKIGTYYVFKKKLSSSTINMRDFLGNFSRIKFAQ